MPRIARPPDLYGATARADELIRQVFRASAQGAIDAVTAEKLSTALVKCASFDMGVVLMAYLKSFSRKHCEIASADRPELRSAHAAQRRDRLC